MSLDNPGKITLGLDVGADRFILERGHRVVTIAAAHVAEMMGTDRDKLAMGMVRSIADVIMEYPSRVGARIEECEELHDRDRRPKAASPECEKCHKPMQRMKYPGGWVWGCPACDGIVNGPLTPEMLENARQHIEESGQADGSVPRCTCTPTRDNPKCPLHGFGAKSDDFQGEVGG